MLKGVLSLFFCISCISSINLNKNDESFGATYTNSQNVEEFNGYNSGNFMVDYFANLNHFTSNISGSCVYNAFNILLDYYDTFWDDDIIPEEYDLNVKNDYDLLGFGESPSSTYQKFYDYTEETPNIFYRMLENNNFVKKLLDIAIDNEIIKHPDSHEPISLTFEQTLNLVHLYFDRYTKSKCSFNEITYFVGKRNNMKELDENLTNDQFLRNETIHLLQHNVPVMLLLGNDTGPCDAVIAYDYDASSNKVYCHFGYENKTHYDYGKDYVYIRGLYAISPLDRNSHVHSNNYVDMNNNQYCSCKLNVHNHCFEYKNFKDGHIAKCFCGLAHIGNLFVNANNVCVFCNRYVKDEDEYAGKE